MAEPVQLFPWATPPSGQGSEKCCWCDRDIYRPAVPCSVQPVDGLLGLQTLIGQGARCKYELSTREL